MLPAASNSATGLSWFWYSQPCVKTPFTLLPNPPVLAINDVLDREARRAYHGLQVTEDIVGVCRRLAADRGALQFPVGRVAVGRAAILRQPVLGIIGAAGRAAGGNFAQAIAVGVVVIGRCDRPILLHFLQPARLVIEIVVSIRHRLDGFNFLRDSAQLVAGIGRAEDRRTTHTRAVFAQFSERAVAPCVRHAPQCRPGDPAML